jgi:hypothetical protein
MKTKWFLALVAMLVSFGTSPQSRAQTLASRSFDLLFAGDDPSERFDFLLPSDPLVPVSVRFDGFFENLDFGETGVRFGLGWRVDGTMWDGRQFTDEFGVRLPGADPVLGSTRVPIHFDQQIDFTPSEIQYWVEGLGPGDRFQFVGDFSIQAVPEPTVFNCLGAAAMAGLLYRQWIKRRHHAPE